MWTRTETDFNLDRHLLVFLQEASFFAEISRNIKKIPTRDMPTAAVVYNMKSDELTMYWNPDFFEKLSNREIRGVLTHEFYHLVFGHLNSRRKTPPRMWNIATDLAINSIIVSNSGVRNDEDRHDSRPLPTFALIPGTRPELFSDGHVPSEHEKAAAEHLADLIAKMPVMQASEWYFNKLQEDKQKNPDKYENEQCDGSCGEGDPNGGQGGNQGDDEGKDGSGGQPGQGNKKCKGGHGVNSMDDHTGWDEIPEEKREYVEGKVKSVIEKAVRHADQQANGWGNVPADLQSDIRRSISNVVNWRAVLKQFIGSMTRGERTTSIKRINRRYPYIHPGIKRGYTARLLIAIDQSGSVDDTQLEMFFSELTSLTKRTTVDILPFDCYADLKDLFEWRKGTTPKVQRVRGGGTDFNAPTEIVNDPKNRGRWDGLLIMTDGECGAPIASRTKRGWVLSKGHKLLFESGELQVFLDDSKPMTGAWR